MIKDTAARRAPNAAARRARRGSLSITIAVMAVLVAAMLAVLVGQSARHDSLVMEYAASRVMTQVADVIFSTGAMPIELPDRVDAFGAYDLSGVAIRRTDTAPETLRLEDADSRGPASPGLSDGTTYRDGRTLVMIRAAGGRGLVAALGTAEAANGPLPEASGISPQGGRGAGRGGQSSANRVYLYLEYDVSAFVRERNVRIGGLSFLALTVAVLALALSRMIHSARIAEQRAQQQEQLAQLGAAARTITHEIKNPLASIRLQTALLKKTAPESAAGPITAIDSDVNRLARLVDEVRSFLKDPRGNPELLDVHAELPELAGRLAYDVQVTVHEVGTRAATICMDRSRFESAIGNLVANAAESMTESPAGGIRGTEDSAPPEPVTVEMEVSGDSVQIRIGDRGPGIPDTEKARIFDPFYTTKDTGSGVGLAIVRQSVDAARGSVEVRDRSGGGTWVVVILPRRTSCASTDS